MDIDAYTLRKIAPRILLGVIAVNLSIYICVAASDLTVIVGKGIGSLITTPFIGAGNFDFNLTQGGGIASILEGLGITALAGYGLYSVIVPLIGFIGGGAAGLGGFLVFSILIPAFLIILAVLVTIAIRQGLLVFLILISPIAFALYVLPGTEKYFRQWWDLFVKTLLVYPIIAVIFALSDVMAVVGVQSTPSSTAAIVIGLIFAFLPLILIPFSFRFAGGAMATLASVAQNAYGRANKDGGFLNTRKRHFRQEMGDSTTRGRADLARRGGRMSDSAAAGLRGRATRFAGRSLRRSAHGYTGSIFKAESELNKRMADEQELATGFGDDSLWRAYTWSQRKEDTRIQNGRHQVRTAGGAWVDRSAYDQAVAHFGGTDNSSAYQRGLTYEMGKAITQEQQDHLYESFLATTGGEHKRFTGDEAIGVWKGAAFNKQNENRQWKYYTPEADQDGQFRISKNGLGLLQEVDEKQGSYASTMQNADTWTTMSESMEQAHETVGRLAPLGARTAEQEREYQDAQETLTRGFRIAQSLSSGYDVPVDENNPAAGRRRIDSTGAGAPGRVGEEIRAYAKIANTLAGHHGYNPDQYGTERRSDEATQSQADRSPDRRA